MSFQKNLCLELLFSSDPPDSALLAAKHVVHLIPNYILIATYFKTCRIYWQWTIFRMHILQGLPRILTGCRSVLCASEQDLATERAHVRWFDRCGGLAGGRKQDVGTRVDGE